MEAWGYSLGLDVKECSPATIRSKELLQEYVIKLCKLIDMKRYGDIIIEHFGTGNKEGFTIVQLIETSSITGHFSNDTNCAYIDIFSCNPFSQENVAAFTMEFFGAETITTHLVIRGE